MASAVTFLGHAGFIVEHQGVRVLMDPWFHSAFLYSWFPYPDNRYLMAKIQAERFHYLYVSHTHEDHYDERLLKVLDRAITIIIPDYRSRSLLRRFRGLGFKTIIALGHKQTHELAPGFSVTMYLDTSHKEDSGLLLDLGEFRFLDLNDCNTPMSELPENIDLLAAQFSGAMWYPNCYDYPAHVMQNKVAGVRGDLMNTLYRKVNLTRAKAYIPSAGPPCFLDPVLEQYNDTQKTIFPHWEDVASDFVRVCPEVSVLRLNPGDAVQIADSRPAVDPMPDARSQEEITEYRERRRNEWGEFNDSPETPLALPEIEAYFSSLQRRNKHLVHEFHKEILLSSGGKTWGVHLGKLAEDFVIEGEEPYDPEYTFVLPLRVLRAIVDGRTGWEEALLSMRIGLRREPDVFDLKLMSLLRYGNTPSQTLQLVRERSITETIERDGLQMQRFCPHAGEDMMHAVIRGGIVECARHHWKWDARTGECLEGGNLALKVKVLDPSSPALERQAERRRSGE